MGLLFLDGFDKYAQKSDLALRSSTNFASVTASIEAGLGRFGGKAVKHSSTAGSINFAFPTTQTGQVKIAFHMKMLGSQSTLDNVRLFAIRGNSQLGACGAYVSIPATDNQLICEKCTSSALSSYIEATRVSTPFTANTWHHIEIHYYCHASSGTWRLIVDETDIINYTGDTNALGSLFQNLASFEFVGASGPSGTLIDDLVVWNTTGVFAPTILGPHRIDTLSPTANGDTNDLTPSAGLNYQNVDDAAFHDGDTTYNQGNTVGGLDLFALDDLPVTPETIYGVQVVNRLKSSAGGQDASCVVKQGGTLKGTAGVTIPTSYTQKNGFFTKNPSTNAAWTPSEINSAQIGIELTDLGTYPPIGD